MKIAPFVVLPLVTLPAMAFDAWDFHSGMSPEQVAAVAARLGYDSPLQIVEQTVRFQEFSYSKKASVYEIGYVAAFCDGRLYWLSHDYAANNMGTLFELLNELKPVYGTPTVNTTSSVATEGRVRTIRFEFSRRPDDVASLSVHLNLRGDTEFGISVAHETSANARCN